MRTERIAGLDVVLAGGADGAGGGTGPAVVLMHGFGTPADDLVPLSRVLDLPREMRFVFPAGPTYLPGHAGGRAWWLIDIEHLNRVLRGKQSPQRTRQVPAGLPEARARVIALLDELPGRLEIPDGKLVLGGFSQGAMLACDVVAHADHALAGLVLLSGTLFAEEQWAHAWPGGAACVRSRVTGGATRSSMWPRPSGCATCCAAPGSTSSGSHSPAATRSPTRWWTGSGASSGQCWIDADTVRRRMDWMS